MSQTSRVQVSVTTIVLPTYLPAAPDKNPMFLEKRVYQGSNGKVYPLPFTDRIAEQPVDRRWQAVWIENEFLKAMILPELGGRIHVLQDKTNGYDLIYHQPVIKPALVGLAGPWISGGIEFNWPQHHRPATFLPVDVEIEPHPDGSQTVWCSDHDPMTRMKGMHGVCLHPDAAYLELKVRAYNRTPQVQTFLWWANVATRVHEAYQSFFPPDVYYVADHARRSMSEYPLAKGFYYGINYGERGRKGVPPGERPTQFVPWHCAAKQKGDQSAFPAYPANDLSFYANIPVPTSYMCMGSREDFFGGYDHAAQAGLVHVANHHISPGKKQWTWGNHDFGYAWDRNLTDPDTPARLQTARGGNGKEDNRRDTVTAMAAPGHLPVGGSPTGTSGSPKPPLEYGPYIEIMAGVYTDNQPDFSFLQPGETKTWSQFWYPIQQIGPAQHANLNAAVALRSANAAQPGELGVGVAVTRSFPRAKIILLSKEKTIFSATQDLAPGKPFRTQVKLPRGITVTNLNLRVIDRDGGEIIAYQPRARAAEPVPPPATEPPAPEAMASADELFITGLHLEQYRHATRCPTLYWREALRRDPLDCRCNNALGRWHLRRGEFASAEACFRNAIARLTRRNANPADGEAYYQLGLCLRFLERDGEAYDAFYKACWNQAWMAAGYHALAEIDCGRRDWPAALDHLDRSLRMDVENLRARNLKVIVLRQLRREREAAALLGETLALDPLDWWARHLAGHRLHCDAQTALDLAHDFARAGWYEAAILMLAENVAQRRETSDLPDQSWGAEPLVQYTLGWLAEKAGVKSGKQFQMAATLPPDYCFPARLEEIAVLQAALRSNPRDAHAPYYLGNLLYDRRRHREAIALWERSAKLNPNEAVVWRNLGLGYFNVLKSPAKARAAYDRALAAAPGDARLLLERDQLWKRLGVSAARRRRELEERSELVRQRDDLTVEYGWLLIHGGRLDEAAQLVAGRNFQPWEGGEGGPLGLHTGAQLALGRRALARHNYPAAVSHFEFALQSPPNLGEARHPLANQSDLHYWLGVALAAAGNPAAAQEHWLTAANFKGDFQEMSVRTCSEMTYFSALAWRKLGQDGRSKKLLRELLAYAQALQTAPATIDYFATSLQTMLLFADDLQYRQETTALFLQAQARLGLGQTARGKALLRQVIQRDPSHRGLEGL